MADDVANDGEGAATGDPPEPDEAAADEPEAAGTEPEGAGTGEPDGEGRENLEAEVERLQVENAALAEQAAHPGAAGGRRRFGGVLRSIMVGLLVALSCLLVFLSVEVDWLHHTVLTTDGFVSTVGPIIKEDRVTTTLGAELTDQLFTTLDVQHRVEEVLPPRAAPLAGPITGAVHGFVQDQVTKVLQSDRFEKFWYAALRFGHGQILDALRGKTSSLVINDHSVALNLLPLMNAALEQVQSRASGLLGRNIKLPTITSAQLPAAAQERLSKALGVKVPSDFGQITLLKSDKVKLASNAVTLLDALVWLLPLASLLAIAAALALSTHRRRTLLQLAVALFLLFVLVRRITFRIEAELIASAKPENQGAASDIIHQLLSNYFTITLWVLWISGIVALGALVSGPYRWARAMRHGVATAARYFWGALGELVRVIAGRSEPGVGLGWARAHRGWLQAGGAVVGAILLFTLPWIGVLVTLVVLIVYELVLWRLPPAPPPDEGPAPGAEQSGRPSEPLTSTG